jgi:hypothetical protein
VKSLLLRSLPRPEQQGSRTRQHWGRVMYFDEKWIEKDNGNLVWMGPGGPLGTVYETAPGVWGAVWNNARDGQPRRLKAKFDRREDARSAMENAVSEGEASLDWWPPDRQWRKAKKGGYYRRVSGATVSVKQAQSGAWYAVSMAGALLGESGIPTWFTAPDDARNGVDEFARGSIKWGWVKLQ